MLNVSLVREVRRSTRYLQNQSNAGVVYATTHREELQITVMLISIVIVFFICQVHKAVSLYTFTVSQ